ncbi:MAG: ABC transporter ATP-binding protein [Actinomycetota bacterium]
MSNAVVFDDVSFAYPDEEIEVLRDVTLGVPEGSFVLVTGATGAGKSTFLRATNGLVPHFSGGRFRGKVEVEGRDTREHAPRRLADVIAFVPQDPGASFVVDRVEDELAYAMENLAVEPAMMRRRVEESLDLLGIEPLRTRSVRSLSGGERQRVAIAAALTPGPRILVLDEPTSQLDPQGAEDVLAALQRMVHDLGMTVILAEHRLERVAGFADLAIGAAAGMFEIGPPADVIARHSSGPPVARLARLAGWDEPVPLTVREARRRAPKLRCPDHRSATPRGRALLRAEGVTAAYTGDDVLTGVDLGLGAGEIVALMGRNGSGKSTFLRCLAGLHQPRVGTVSIDGAAPRPGRDVALCPQEPDSILFKDSVRDEVAATLRWADVDGDPDEIIASLGLDEFAEHHPRDLSAGERLLVATAATAATGAPVLLLDEPTRGLDVSSKEKLAKFLRSRAAAGHVAMFATHDVELAAEIATRVVMLANGEVIADGAPREVLGDSAVFAPQMTRVFGAGWLTPEQVAEELHGSLVE